MTIFKNISLNPLKLYGLLLALGMMTLAGCEKTIEPEHAEEHVEEHAEEQAHGDEYERGPNRGRLLKSGAFALEITIFEAGSPPQFRVFPYVDGTLVDPASLDVTIALGRLDGAIDHFAFHPENTYLTSDGIVVEPHSFDVRVTAKYGGQEFDWTYQSYEGRTMIDSKTAQITGIEVEAAGPAIIEETLDVLGRIDLAPGAEAKLRARYPGQVIAVYKTVGDNVRAGERLARIESNESLQEYDLVSPINGVVLERLTNLGDVSGQAALFIVGDLTQLRVDFHVFPKDLHRVTPGQQVVITSLDDRLTAMTEIYTFLPTKELETQTVIARAALSNSDKSWMPGMTVRGDIIIKKEEVPLAVRTKALQRFRDFTVVFARVGETYEVRMLELGRQTSQWTEVLGGISPGQDYVTKNSFLIKADIEKSGASHDH